LQLSQHHRLAAGLACAGHSQGWLLPTSSGHMRPCAGWHTRWRRSSLGRLRAA